MPDASLSSLLLAWYRRHARTLPWRNDPDPYAVWVSEIMLQQTRVETVIPYFERWMERFPSVRVLSEASEEEVLAVWEGLGYYSRARNMHKAARILVEEHGGELPRDTGVLRSLPGIGRYTVGAIASIAFGMDEPTLDGNLRRVFSRLFDVTDPADSPAGEKKLWSLAAKYLPRGRAGDYNQALMDLGATICLPKKPRCLLCPLAEICRSRMEGTQDLRPVLKPGKKTPHVVHAAAVIVKRGRVLLTKRPSTGLLGGMWEFPNTSVAADPVVDLARGLGKSHGLKLRVGDLLLVLDHAYTHFRVTLHAYHCDLAAPPGPSKLRWVWIKRLGEYPMGRIDRQIARKLSR